MLVSHCCVDDAQLCWQHLHKKIKSPRKYAGTECGGDEMALLSLWCKTWLCVQSLMAIDQRNPPLHNVLQVCVPSSLQNKTGGCSEATGVALNWEYRSITFIKNWILVTLVRSGFCLPLPRTVIDGGMLKKPGRPGRRSGEFPQKWSPSVRLTQSFSGRCH